MGGTTADGATEVMFGSTHFMFRRADTTTPSAGSVIDHIGFSFPDLDAKVAEWQGAGVKIVTPVRDVPGIFKLGFIEDPWGVRIEVVQDPDTLGFHHIRLRAKDPDGLFTWLADAFGGERAQLKGRLDGLRYDGLWAGRGAIATRLASRARCQGCAGNAGRSHTRTVRSASPGPR